MLHCSLFNTQIFHKEPCEWVICFQDKSRSNNCFHPEELGRASALWGNFSHTVFFISVRLYIHPQYVVLLDKLVNREFWGGQYYFKVYMLLLTPKWNLCFLSYQGEQKKDCLYLHSTKVWAQHFSHFWQEVFFFFFDPHKRITPLKVVQICVSEHFYSFVKLIHLPDRCGIARF